MSLVTIGENIYLLADCPNCSAHYAATPAADGKVILLWNADYPTGQPLAMMTPGEVNCLECLKFSPPQNSLLKVVSAAAVLTKDGKWLRLDSGLVEGFSEQAN